jgi:hypothetical protein
MYAYAALLFSFLFFTMVQGSLAYAGAVRCSIKTYNSHFLTAVSGGGRTSDVLHTDATRLGSWEKFYFVDSEKGVYPTVYGIRTMTGNYLTAVGGGGQIYDVMHSDANFLRAWEEFTLVPLGLQYYAIRTVKGYYLTAVSGGGRRTDAIHSDATQIREWERFKITCGI